MTKGEKKEHGKVINGSWRSAYGKLYLSSDDLDDNQELNLTISLVTEEQAIDPGTKKMKSVVAIHFEGTDRLLAGNVANLKIAELAGSNQCVNWVGLRVCLYKIYGTFFGKDGTPALRVKAAAQKSNSDTANEAAQA